MLAFGGSLFAQTANPEMIPQLEWLVGKWERQNMKPGKMANERWESSAGFLNGWGVSLKGVDTVFVEKLQIVRNEQGLFYVADVAENEAPVYFEIVEISESGFRCVNPEHDFPKQINYVRKGDRLEVTISGDGRSVDFIFLREGSK